MIISDLSKLDKFRDVSEITSSPTVVLELGEEVGIAPLYPTRRILAFDQSLANTGFAFVVGKRVMGTGNLKSKVSLSGHQGTLDRVVPLYHEMYSTIVRWEPDLVVYETPPVGGRMMRPESSLMAATVLRIAAAEFVVPIRMVGAQTVKKRLTGNGNAKKKMVREAIKRRDPSVTMMKPLNEGIFDAIGLAWVATEGE